MISEKDLENRIKVLKNIQPRADWQSSLKSQIMNGDITPSYEPTLFDNLVHSFTLKHVTAVITLMVIGFGVFFTFVTAPTSGTSYYLSQAEADIRSITELAKADAPSMAAAIQTTRQSLRDAINSVPTKVTTKEETEQMVAQVAKINQAIEEARLELGDSFATSEQKVLADRVVKCVERSISSAQAQLAVIIENEINALSERDLTGEEQALLGEAKIEFAKWLEEGDWKALENSAEMIYLLANK